MSTADLATAMLCAGVATVSAHMREYNLPGKARPGALAKAFGVPPGAPQEVARTMAATRKTAR